MHLLPSYNRLHRLEYDLQIRYTMCFQNNLTLNFQWYKNHHWGNRY